MKQLLDGVFSNLLITLLAAVAILALLGRFGLLSRWYVELPDVNQ